MDKTGAWTLSPAFDITWAYNAAGDWTNRHQMSMNGKRDGFERADFDAFADTTALSRGRARTIVDEVTAAVRRWPEFAADAKVEDSWLKTIPETFGLLG
jgi:serine/threonine-protein kinase HipA